MSELDIRARAGVVLCDERTARCRCREPKGHEPPHRCPCGGAWNGREEDDTFEIIEWPQGIGPAQLLMGMFPWPVPGLDFREDW